MKIEQLNEAVSYRVVEIRRSDQEGLYDFCDFYNESDQLSWTLTPSRLLGKIGSTGRLYALQYDDKLVGTLGLKQADVTSDSFEIGYIMIADAHRSLKNVMSLYKAAKKRIKSASLVYATTNRDNLTINKLMEFTRKFKKVALVRSTFSTNQLYLWVSTQAGDIEENTKILLNDYGSHIIRIER